MINKTLFEMDLLWLGTEVVHNINFSQNEYLISYVILSLYYRCSRLRKWALLGMAVSARLLIEI